MKKTKFTHPFAKKALLLLSAALMLSSCNHDTGQGIPNLNETITKKEPVVIEDYVGRSIMETDTGYYYNNGYNPQGHNTLGLHYVDKTSGKDIFLCSKPECKHDGNEFCVATNAKYQPFGIQLYGGYIYVAAISDGDTTHDFKLLRISLDGSSLSEVTTFYSMNQVSSNPPQNYISQDRMLIHRGKVFLQFTVGGEKNFEDTITHANAIYDMETGLTSFLNEEPLSRDNATWRKLTPVGDCVYYLIDEPHKHILHCYHLSDGSDETLQLLTNFTGDFVVTNNGNIFYLRGTKDKLCVRRTDGTNEELEKFTETMIQLLSPEDTNYQMTREALLKYAPAEESFIHEFQASRLLTDGTYVYATNYSRHISYRLVEVNVEDIEDKKDIPDNWITAGVQVGYRVPAAHNHFEKFDSDGNSLGDLDISYEKFFPEAVEDPTLQTPTPTISFADGKVYFKFGQSTVTLSGANVYLESYYVLTDEEFQNGTPLSTPIFTNERKLNYD